VFIFLYLLWFSLIELLDLKGRSVSMNGLGAQRAICFKITELSLSKFQ